ncbi:UNVERIFIED_CONTAM: hypothetical protein GTU68_013651 [Idotea baltica]|nr:hypothetical protein [Idotea baltica]
MIGLVFKANFHLLTYMSEVISNDIKQIQSKLNFNKLKRIQKYSSSLANKIEFDYDYLCNKQNTQIIKENILKRNSDGNIDQVISLYETFKTKKLSKEDKEKLEKDLQAEAIKIPNIASPHVWKYGDSPHVIKKVNDIPVFNFKPKEFHSLAENHYALTMNKHLSLMAGPRSYIFSGALADLERALIRYSVSVLLKKGFTLISVPDLLHSHIIERCGMQTKGERSQVYHLSSFKNQDVCLSGTAEMALGGFLQDRLLNVKELPLKLAALSRCYREEVGKESSEKGIYRVHQFNKVEMFGVTANESGEESARLYQELLDIQVELFSSLGFHFQVLDMPLNELGNPAYTKTDIEAWIPVKQVYGEISSASNCLDYQSRRLNLKYESASKQSKFAHTLNGTACATPRTLLALVASNQTKEGSIKVPDVLQPFMNGVKSVSRPKNPLNIHHFNDRVYSGTIARPDEVQGS